MRGFREVNRFRREMLRVLNQPRHRAKGPLSGIPLHVFRKKFAEERHELEEAISFFYSAGNDTEARIERLRRVEEESVDVGNVAAAIHAQARKLRGELEGR